MVETDFNYKRKPSLASFLHTYIFSFGAGFLLLATSNDLSDVVASQILQELNVPTNNLLWSLPYGVIFSTIFFIYGARALLWNVMSFYEISSSKICMVIGSITRSEHSFLVSDFYDITYKQNFLEALLKAGRVVLFPKAGSLLILPGIHDPKGMVEALRPHLTTDAANDSSGPIFPKVEHKVEHVEPSMKASDSNILSPKRKDGHELESSVPPATHRRPEKTVVVHKGGGCMGCLIIMLIVILIPAFLAIVFKIAVIGAFVEFMRRLLGG